MEEDRALWVFFAKVEEYLEKVGHTEEEHFYHMQQLTFPFSKMPRHVGYFQTRILETLHHTATRGLPSSAFR